MHYINHIMVCIHNQNRMEQKMNIRYRPETIHSNFIKAEHKRGYNALYISTKRTCKTVIILCERTSGIGENIKCVL